MTTHLPVINTENVLEVTPPESPPVKKHVSYSELVCWLECSYRHFLKYIKKIDLDGPSVHTEFGHTMHDMGEVYLRTRVMPDPEEAKVKLTELFTKYNFEYKDKEFQDTIAPIAAEIPGFLDEHFKDWKYIGAEDKLYEAAGVQDDFFFKGFIDGIIQVPKSSRLKRAKPDEMEYWIIDWKTTGWGWTMEKKTDKKKILQLAFYKHFWAKKLGIDPKEIRCGFILLKRTPAKDKPRCELVAVSIGEKTINDALNDLGRMIGSVKKKFMNKNRNSCKFCVYKGTAHCT
jgi:hypothetical protein